MVWTRATALIVATVLAAACAGPIVHEHDKHWWTTNPAAGEKEFAWAAVRCGVPRAAWEVRDGALWRNRNRS